MTERTKDAICQNPDSATEVRLALLEQSNVTLQQSMKAVLDTQQAIGTAIVQLVESDKHAEARHADFRATVDRAFSLIEKQDTRIAEMERAMPGLKEARAWLIAGLIAVVAMAGTLIWDRVTERHPPIPIYPPRGS